MVARISPICLLRCFSISFSISSVLIEHPWKVWSIQLTLSDSSLSGVEARTHHGDRAGEGTKWNGPAGGRAGGRGTKENGDISVIWDFYSSLCFSFDFPFLLVLLLIFNILFFLSTKYLQVRRVGAKPPVEREPYALYCFGLKNPLRKFLIELVEYKAFEVSRSFIKSRRWSKQELRSTRRNRRRTHPLPGLHPDGHLRYLPLSCGLPAHAGGRHHCCQRVPGQE